MGDATDKNIIREAQKLSEELLYKEDTFFKHPYSLSIDLYVSTLSSLLEIGDAVLYYLNRPEQTPVYRVNKSRLSIYVTILDNMLQEESTKSYFDIAPTLISNNENDVQAKL